MQVKQFRYPVDNFGYIIYGKKSALVIDGGAVDAIISFADTNGLKIEYITNTHTHPDHTSGNKEILERTNAVFIKTGQLYNKKFIEIEKGKIQIFHTPGHTENSFSFLSGRFLISGDTLFNGKAGRCFSGDMKSFLKSIKTIMAMPESTVIYAGHDYVREYMDLAKKLEPDNIYIDMFLKKYNPDHVYSTLGEELKINPSLRFNDKKMISIMKKRNLRVDTEFDRWKSIMSIVTP